MSLSAYIPTILGLITVTLVASLGLYKVERFGDINRAAWIGYITTTVLLLALLTTGLFIPAYSHNSAPWTRYAAALVVGSAVEMAIFFVGLAVSIARNGYKNTNRSSV